VLAPLAILRWRSSCSAFSLTLTAADATVAAVSLTTCLTGLPFSSTGSFFSSEYGGGAADGVKVSWEVSGDEKERDASGVSVDYSDGYT
jgi:hypothetical protein